MFAKRLVTLELNMSLNLPQSYENECNKPANLNLLKVLYGTYDHERKKETLSR